MIQPEQHLLIWVILIAVSLFGMISERKRWFGKLAGVLVTILTMAILSTIGVVPSASDPNVTVPAYSFVTEYLLPMAIPLLLFNADMKAIIGQSGKLLRTYLIGSVGIVIGAIVAYSVINLGAEGFKVLGVFTATLIGGSVNFMATAETFGFTSSRMFAASIAVDNFVVSLFIFLLFFIPSINVLAKYFPNYSEQELTGTIQKVEEPKFFDMEKLAVVLGISGVICAGSFYLGPVIKTWTGVDINFDILIITAIIILLVNIFPRGLKKYAHTAFEAGLLMMYLFLAVIGAATNPKDIFLEGPVILLFCLVTLFIHLLFLLLVTRFFKVSLKEIAVASAANVGGPTIAAPMAASIGAKKLITPAILVGILGYVIGTAVGVSLGLWAK